MSKKIKGPKSKALRKALKKAGFKIKEMKLSKLKPEDMMGFLTPTDNQAPDKIEQILGEPNDETYQGLSTKELLHYAGVHSQRMNDLGYPKTGLVLEWLAGEIERLHADVVRLNNEAIELNKKVTQPSNERTWKCPACNTWVKSSGEMKGVHRCSKCGSWSNINQQENT